MKNILVLTDFSDNATHAAEYAYQLGVKAKAGLTLCNTFMAPVIVPEMGGGGVWIEDEYNLQSESSKLQLKHLQKRLQRPEGADAADVNFQPVINTVSLPGILADVIVENILEEGTELIVLGTHDKDSLGDILLGNEVKELIEKVNFPLLLVPAAVNYKKIKKIAFAIELQQEDNDVAVVRKLIRFAELLKADIFLVHIFNGQDEKTVAEARLNRVLKIVGAKESYPHLTAELFDGKNLEKTLDKICQDKKIDVLSMVHQQHSFLQRVFGSSHTKNMSDHIDVPLLVIPHEPGCVK
ncbi:universal stress protein [Mucilaginibacter sp. FT3.2]|uniref:universal stress protein n=1 Tax=Mucilaginibacter sp. FT3.2 TaxID=2723090 RepID=UPI001609C703|nr:universal stress protein [Mucilaginibacter sp. FT3.2]MBB6235116.1 nucleotide-binding universal stress UspA family protein [Mucilaginibacter sp. FT3.2]